MHVSLTVPNPLARLMRVLAAFAEARDDRARAPVAGRIETSGGVNRHAQCDLEDLSLSRSEGWHGDGWTALESLAMTREAEVHGNGHDDLSAASLTRSEPRCAGS